MARQAPARDRLPDIRRRLVMMSRLCTLNPVAVAGMVGGVAAMLGLIALVERYAPIPNLSILFLLPVMLCAVTWGWWSALAASLLAFVAYNYLFVEPRYTFMIYDPQEWLALLIFLVVAAVTSTLAARERARRDQASRQARTATFLYELSRALGGPDLNAGLGAVAERLRSELRLDGVAVARSVTDGRLAPIVAVGRAEDALGSDPIGRVFAPPVEGGRVSRWIIVPARGAAHHARAAVANFPLRHDGQQIGMLRLVGRPDGLADDETSLLATIADRLAITLASEALREEANRVEILCRTDELRKALLNSVSHDLRTPLAAIKASAESLLQKDVEWSEDDRDGFAAAIDREADRLNRLVTNLLDMSRIEGGALRPRRDWYDLGELVREVLARLEPTLDGRTVEMTVASEILPVSLDYLMIDQVVANLVENAAKYTPATSPILVAIEATADSVRLAVEDRGPGIPPDRRDRVFDTFYRLETAGRARGSGLGLAVSKGLVEGHGGRIWAEMGGGPPEAPGARFIVEIPRTGRPESGPGPEAPAPTIGDQATGAAPPARGAEP